MTPFAYVKLDDPDAVVAHLAATPGARVIGGGTTLLDLMKDGVEQADELVDITGLPLTGIVEGEDGLEVGALATMSAVARHQVVRARLPLVAETLLAGATPQLRNMATIGGNLLQRTRCWYFRDPGFAACNKRSPGSGCSALEGEHQRHAVLGTSDRCIAAHASDLAVALVALDARVDLLGAAGPRSLAVEALHRLPGDTPERETELAPGELITRVVVPFPAEAARWAYRKVRDRASFEFAVVSAAVGVEVADGLVVGARVALGGVATKPWRCRQAEAALVGRAPGEDAFRAAADVALAGARPRPGNAYKIELARCTLVRALADVTTEVAP
ncbi:MAG: xanthine dehydrogenase family protein subunit M [Acidimicrobiia bacterium]|nr:xanthine dehydrogenase family protein subunit M [Acidimicrobiia bacterium]